MNLVEGPFMARQLKTFLLATAFCASLAPAASAQDAGRSGIYVSLGAGVHMPSDTDARFSNLPPPIANFSGRLESDSGYMVTGALGYKWLNGFRTEVEANWRRADLSAINGMAAGGRQSVLGGMANILYDFDSAFDSAFGLAPYVGGGVGIAHQEWKNVQGNLGVPIINAEFDAFQWQLIGGVNMSLGSRANVFAEYRFIKVGDKDVGILAGSTARLVDQKSHNILLGVRLFF